MRGPQSRPGPDETGTSQTSIRHHPLSRGAMRRYAVAPIHTGGVALRPVGPRDATSVPPSILTPKPSFTSCAAPALAGRSGRPGCRPLFTEASGGPGGSGPQACHAIAPGLGPAGSARTARRLPHASRAQTRYLQFTRLTEAPFIVSHLGQCDRRQETLWRSSGEFRNSIALGNRVSPRLAAGFLPRGGRRDAQRAAV